VRQFKVPIAPWSMVQLRNGASLRQRPERLILHS
jgi:hypothetical protein